MIRKIPLTAYKAMAIDKSPPWNRLLPRPLHLIQFINVIQLIIYPEFYMTEAQSFFEK